MKKLLAQAITCISLLSLTSCAGMSTTPRAVSVSDDEAFTYINRYLAEYEGMKQSLDDKKVIYWIQPANKKEQCKVFVGTLKEDDRTAKPGYKIYWDGQCRNGYAYGLGREFEKGGLTDLEAIAMYSGEEKEPEYYYQKDNLKNIIQEGDITNGYAVATNIKEESLTFSIEYRFGYFGRGGNPVLLINSSPMQDNVAFIKGYPNFSYRIIDATNNEFSNIKASFETVIPPTWKTNGFSYALAKNGTSIAAEVINGERTRFVTLQQSYLSHATKILDEIKEAGQKAINAQQNALAVKKQYKNAICKEDKYMAQVKEKLDAALTKIKTEKDQKRNSLAQARIVRAQEAQAMAAQRQAAAAQAQADAAAWANFNQSMHNMNMNNQMQQLNNNLFMMRMGY